VETAGLGSAWKCSLICELVSLFVDYQEEGTPLFLDAFVTSDLTQMVAPIPQSTCLRIGVTSFDEDGVRSAVKKTAPLVRGCWKMYLCASGGDLMFGLFRDSGHPLNVPINVAIQSGGVGSTPFLRITKTAQDSVKVASHDGKEVLLSFTNAKAAAADAGETLELLSKQICSGLEDKSAQHCTTYLNSLLSTAIRESHGALVAVVSSKRLPASLKDCTRWDPPLDVGGAVTLARNDPTTLPQLNALGSIVCGIFCTDGVVVFDTRARVLAYGAFVRLKASSAIGGARKRAFEALSKKLGIGLVAVFFQSQDGASDLRRYP
jgi:hypothetical protein